MKTSDAFMLAGKINFNYNRKLINSIAINTEIAQALGIVGYAKFCEEIAKPEYRKDLRNTKNYFIVSFIENIVVDEDCATDIEVVNNYSFDSIMKILAKITN